MLNTLAGCAEFRFYSGQLGAVVNFHFFLLFSFLYPSLSPSLPLPLPLPPLPSPLALRRPSRSHGFSQQITRARNPVTVECFT